MTILVMGRFLLAGLFGYASLPVNELPMVDFPTLVVTGQLPGADAHHGIGRRDSARSHNSR